MRARRRRIRWWLCRGPDGERTRDINKPLGAKTLAMWRYRASMQRPTVRCTKTARGLARLSGGP
eukprot:12114787-Alexandrium_andersonii.AAC.1